MTTPKPCPQDDIRLSDTAKAILPIRFGLVLVSGPAHSGKTTTLSLLGEEFAKRHGNKEVAYIDFNGNGIDEENRIFSFEPFRKPGELPTSLEEKESERESRFKWELSIKFALASVNPLVLIIDDLPDYFVNGAMEEAEAGRIVIASVIANSVESALGNCRHILDEEPAQDGFQRLRLNAEAAIWQELTPVDGGFTLESYGVDIDPFSTKGNFCT